MHQLINLWENSVRLADLCRCYKRSGSDGGLGWYSPNFGEVNDYLDDIYTDWTDLKFEEGMMYGAAVEYEITPNSKLRGEQNGFNAETSDSDGVGWMAYEAEYKLNVNAYTLSGIYTMTLPKSHYLPILEQVQVNL